jgi:hypothetical protein
MMMVLSVSFMVCVSFFRIFSSLIMVVLRSVSSPSVKLWALAKSVKLMYKASSLVVSCFAVVVFPVHDVPVIRMTRFMKLIGWTVVVIGFGFCFCSSVSCALGFNRISPSSIFLVTLLFFTSVQLCFHRRMQGESGVFEPSRN